MTPQDVPTEQPETPRNDQSRPETGIETDPSENTTPPLNPPVDERAVAEGEEKLGSIVNW